MNIAEVPAHGPNVKDLPWIALHDISGLLTVPVWSAEGPSAAAVLRLSKAQAYRMANNGGLPVVRLSPQRIVVSVPRLLAMFGAGGPSVDSGRRE